MRLASEIINLDVFSLEDNAVLGKVRDLIVDPENGKLIALQIYGRGISKDRNLISILEIKYFDSEMLAVESKKQIESKQEMPKAYEILKAKIRILKNKVFTENGDYLGRVRDFALDFNDTLARIYVSRAGFESLVGYQRIFSFSQILEISARKIIVFDKSLNTERDPALEIST